MSNYRFVSVAEACYDFMQNASTLDQTIMRIQTPYPYYLADGTQSTAVFSMQSSRICKELGDYFGNYTIMVDKTLWGQAPLTPDRNILRDVFSQWFQDVRTDIIALCTAYYSIYNPLENYNGTETSTDEYGDSQNPFKRTKTISGKVKQNTDIDGYSQAGTVTPGADITADAYSGVDIEHSESTFDDQTYKNVSKDSSPLTGGHSKTKGDAASNYTTWDDYKEESTEEGTKTTTLNKHGNLGVTTSQQMVQSELDMRTHNLYMEVLRRFAHDKLSLINVNTVLEMEGM